MIWKGVKGGSSEMGYGRERIDFREPNMTTLFGMLTKETVNTLFTGKLVTGTVR